MFRVIVMTLPEFIPGEADRIAELLRSGQCHMVDVRKPGASPADVQALIDAVPADVRGQVFAHDRRRSCHTAAEVAERKRHMDFVTLSPIFDSVSKQGYRSAFTANQIHEYAAKGIVDHRVYALGGVFFCRLPQVRAMGFGGAVVLGDAWRPMRTVLTIAASDPSAGAGIQQDIKTITSLGHYAVSATTALTAQSTRGVEGVMDVPPHFFRQELDPLLADVPVHAVKIGVIPNIHIARIIRSALQRLSVPVVLDPVLASTSGWQFLDSECIDYIRRHIFPLCTLITPNLPEYERIGPLPDANVLVKGGHGSGPMLTDTLHCADGTRHTFTSPRIATTNLHGTGCTLSSAIAARLAEGLPLPQAVDVARLSLTQGIARGAGLRIGHGNGPLWMFGTRG